MTGREHLDAFLEELMAEGATLDELGQVSEIVPARVPPPALRARLLGSIAQGRLHRFAARVAAMLDVDEERARELLDGVDDPTAWGPGPALGVELYHVRGGPAVHGAITGFIRVARGGVFPEHEHLGREEVLVVQGSLRDSDEQQVLGPGEETRKQAGTSHRIEVLPGPALVYLVIIREGVRIGPRVLRPGDPDI